MEARLAGDSQQSCVWLEPTHAEDLRVAITLPEDIEVLYEPVRLSSGDGVVATEGQVVVVAGTYTNEVEPVCPVDGYERVLKIWGPARHEWVVDPPLR